MHVYSTRFDGALNEQWGVWGAGAGAGAGESCVD